VTAPETFTALMVSGLARVLASKETPMTDNPVTQADRELWKYIIDANAHQSKAVDACPDVEPELQAIAAHRTTHIETVNVYDDLIAASRELRADAEFSKYDWMISASIWKRFNDALAPFEDRL
jgi:hypothetical protein